MRAFTHTLALACWAALVACPKEQPGTRGEAGSTTGGSSTGSATTGESIPTTDAGGTSTGTGAGTGTGTSTGEAGTTGAESSGGAQGTSTSTGEASTTGMSTGSTGAGSTGDGTTGAPARLFDCFGCSCDANVSFCRKVFAGFAGPDDPMCPIVEANGAESGCVLYPEDCSDPPACECLPTMNKNCFCNEQGPGEFEVNCPLP